MQTQTKSPPLNRLPHGNLRKIAQPSQEKNRRSFGVLRIREETLDARRPALPLEGPRIASGERRAPSSTIKPSSPSWGRPIANNYSSIDHYVIIFSYLLFDLYGFTAPPRLIFLHADSCMLWKQKTDAQGRRFSGRFPIFSAKIGQQITSPRIKPWPIRRGRRARGVCLHQRRRRTLPWPDPT